MNKSGLDAAAAADKIHHTMLKNRPQAVNLLVVVVSDAVGAC
jgi:hypothetical protein